MLSAGYLAGLLDGGGCLTILYQHQRTDRGAFSPMIIISQKEADKLKKVYDSLVNDYNIKAGFCKSGHKYDIFISSQAGCISFLKMVSPHLIFKSREASLLLEFCTHKKKLTFDQLKDYYQKLRASKSRKGPSKKLSQTIKL